MRIGPAVRRAFGPLEPTVTDAYRRAFFDLRTLAALVARCAPRTVLEIGCGEGALAEALASALGDARYVGIDVSPRAGRLFRARRTGFEFHVVALEPFAAGHAGAFDLVLLCDVLHHVPPEARAGFLHAAASALRPGGVLVLKEWERRPNLAHLAVWLSDRFVTGDAVRFETAVGLEALVAGALPALSLEARHRLPPWSNNVAFLYRSA